MFGNNVVVLKSSHDYGIEYLLCTYLKMMLAVLLLLESPKYSQVPFHFPWSFPFD